MRLNRSQIIVALSGPSCRFGWDSCFVPWRVLSIVPAYGLSITSVADEGSLVVIQKFDSFKRGHCCLSRAEVVLPELSLCQVAASTGMLLADLLACKLTLNLQPLWLERLGTGRSKGQQDTWSLHGEDHGFSPKVPSTSFAVRTCARGALQTCAKSES